MKSSRRATFGLILILFGSVLLLDNLGIIPGLPRFLFAWPMILILIGVINLINGNRGPALIFFALGFVFYLDRYFYIDFDTYWPAILVIVGLALVLGNRSYTSGKREINDSYFEEFNIFGASNKIIASKELKGGRITNIFGGTKADLREASPVDGALIEVTTIFGGCDIIVPDHWDISINTTSIFGGFEDKRPKSTGKSDYKIYIKGFTLFGGGDLKSPKN